MYLTELKQETVKNNLSNLQETKGLNIGFGIYVGTEAEKMPWKGRKWLATFCFWSK